MLRVAEIDQRDDVGMENPLLAGQEQDEFGRYWTAINHKLLLISIYWHQFHRAARAIGTGR